MTDIMTPEHPRWQEFCEMLEGPEYCNFHEEVPGNINTFSFTCDNSKNRPFARAILEKMGGFNVDASLDAIYRLGGHCDCEILFNADPDDDDIVDMEDWQEEDDEDDDEEAGDDEEDVSDDEEDER